MFQKTKAFLDRENESPTISDIMQIFHPEACRSTGDAFEDMFLVYANEYVK